MGTPGSPASKTLAILAQDPPANEFLNHPDLYVIKFSTMLHRLIDFRSLFSRQIAAFFLGWVFITSLSCIIYSSVVQNLLLRIIFCLSTNTRTNVPDPEAGPPAPQKSPTIWTTNSRLFTKGDNQTLVFILRLCFVFASVAQFSSLLTFDPDKGAAACGKHYSQS
jgi:hypothetical protein